MSKTVVAIFIFCAGSRAFAGDSLAEKIYHRAHRSIAAQAASGGLDWKVDDEADYAMAVGVFRGTMISRVNSVDAEGIWMSQEINIPSVGKQQVKSLLDRETGDTKRLIVNGKDQPIGKSNYEVVEAVEDQIKVPAGTFPCVRAKLEDRESHETIRMWVNSARVPLSGMIKEIEPSGLGDLTITLIRFKKN